MLVVGEKLISTLKDLKPFDKLTDKQKSTWIEFLNNNIGTHDYNWAFNAIKNNSADFGKTAKSLGTAITNHFMVRDENADPILDPKGNSIPDPLLNDSENVKYEKNIEEYFNEEVLPYVPDAFIDYSVRDPKDGEVGIVGYKINFNRYFYSYVPPRPLHEIDNDLKVSETRIQQLLSEVAK